MTGSSRPDWNGTWAASEFSSSSMRPARERPGANCRLGCALRTGRNRPQISRCPLQSGSGDEHRRRERDGGDQPAVIGLAAMGRAAVAEELVLVGIGAEPEIGEFADPRRLQASADEAGQVEHRVVGPLAGLEEALIPRAETGREIGADL